MAKSRKEHKQAPILDDGEVIFSVDEKLQSLIQFFWDRGIVTFNSCQDNVRGTCWIQFDLSDWIGITEIAFRSEPQDLYRFIEESCDITITFRDDGQPDENDEYWIEGENLIWGASVRFPKGLLPEFEALVRFVLDQDLADSDQTGTKVGS